MLAQGTVLDGRYEVAGLLAAGGMGEVYRAKRVHLGDEVVIKIVRTGDRDPAILRERFLRESRACAQLRHPNIVAILDFDVTPDGAPFLVMEFLNGPSVRDELAAIGRFPAARVTQVLLPVCAAIQLAHDRGIIHRDLKPANIVSHRYGSGEVVYKVIDFGLANLHDSSEDVTRLTMERQFVGTLSYASPEQLRGEPVDARTDVYSLGAVAFEMLTGRPPFSSPDPLAVVSQHLTAAPPFPSLLAEGVPAWMDDAIVKALAKERADRWRTVADFARALAGPGHETTTASTGPAALSGWLGKYELGPLIGRGRLGSEIYAATHRALQHPVAIRTLRREGHPSWAAARARFLREAQTLQVSHPSIIQVRDYGEENDVVYVVTELIEGTSLRELIRAEAPFDAVRLLRFATQLTSATAAIHRRDGLICGLHPEIIRVTHDEEGERVMISSAGIVQVQDLLATMDERSLRGTGVLEPEVPYVAPELFMGQRPDARADLYTIGVLLYEMATGKVPLTAGSIPELLGQVWGRRVRDPRELAPSLPAPLAATIVRCLEPEPADRYAGIAELSAALRAVTV